MKAKKSIVKKSDQSLKFNWVRFSTIGDTYSGTVTNILKGRFGVILQFGNDAISVSQIVLKRLVANAFLSYNFDIGSKVKITFEDVLKSQSGRSVKVFSLYVDGKKIEAPAMKTIDKEEARKTLESQLQKPASDLPF